MSEVSIGSESFIGAEARIGDRARIGQNVIVQAGAEIPADTVVLDGTVVVADAGSDGTMAAASEGVGSETAQDYSGDDALYPELQPRLRPELTGQRLLGLLAKLRSSGS